MVSVRVATGLLVPAMLLLGACAGPSDDVTAGASVGMVAPMPAPEPGLLPPAAPDAAMAPGMAPGMTPGMDAARGETAGGMTATMAGPEVVASQEVVTTVQATVRVDDPAAVADEVATLTRAAGGQVAFRDVSGSAASRVANVTVRVPADRLAGFLAQLRDLGVVEVMSEQASDVTQQKVDLTARTAALRVSITRLQTLLAESGSVADLLAVEAELSRRQAELDSLSSQLDYLADQVALSTVTVSLVPVVVTASASDSAGFVTGLRNGWAAFTTVLAGVTTAAGFAIPFAVALGGVSAAVVALRRAWHRRD